MFILISHKHPQGLVDKLIEENSNPCSDTHNFILNTRDKVTNSGGRPIGAAAQLHPQKKLETIYFFK